jgi:hypothetical protein
MRKIPEDFRFFQTFKLDSSRSRKQLGVGSHGPLLASLRHSLADCPRFTIRTWRHIRVRQRNKSRSALGIEGSFLRPNSAADVKLIVHSGSQAAVVPFDINENGTGKGIAPLLLQQLS